MAKPRRPYVVLLIFANDRYGAHAAYLRNLAAERRAIEAALRPMVDGGSFDVVSITNCSRRELFDALVEHGPRIVGLHFAGHGHPDGLQLEDAHGVPDTAQMRGIALELGRLPVLDWVFLNGCGTATHVEMLHTCMPAVVIATSTAVRDDVAKDFARRFYHALAHGVSYADAFDTACAEAMTGHPDLRTTVRPGHESAMSFDALHRRADLRMMRPVQSDTRWPWVLLAHPISDDIARFGLVTNSAPPRMVPPPAPEPPRAIDSTTPVDRWDADMTDPWIQTSNATTELDLDGLDTIEED